MSPTPSANRLAIIGAGPSGARLARRALTAGWTVKLEDLLPGSLQRARAAIEQDLAGEIQAGRISAAGAQAALQRLELKTEIEAAVASAEVIIEATPESLENKLEIFLTLDRMAPPAARIVTLTDNLSLTELAGVTYRASQCVGMRLHGALAEVVRGLETAEAAAQEVAALAQGLGYTAIIVRESPGLITARLSALLGNEAMQMLQEGVATAAAIDMAMRMGLGHARGPLEQIDDEGLDHRLHLLEALERSLGATYRPPEMLRQYIHAGRLGRKAGRGFFDYPLQEKD